MGSFGKVGMFLTLFRFNASQPQWIDEFPRVLYQQFRVSDYCTSSISNPEFKDDGFGETVMSQWSNQCVDGIWLL